VGGLAIIFISRSKLSVLGDGVFRRWGFNEFANYSKCAIIAIGKILCCRNSIYSDI
jgi:hypothetical protein